MIFPIKNKELAKDMATAALDAIACPTLPTPDFLGDYIVVAWIENDALCGTSVLYGFRPAIGEVHHIFVGWDRRWARRANIRDIIRLVFDGTGIRRVSASVRHDHTASIKATKATGFVREGTRRDGYGPGLHSVEFGMTRADAAKWLRRAYRNHGKVLAAA